jgi:hypothetical protein
MWLGSASGGSAAPSYSGPTAWCTRSAPDGRTFPIWCRTVGGPRDAACRPVLALPGSGVRLAADLRAPSGALIRPTSTARSQVYSRGEASLPQDRHYPPNPTSGQDVDPYARDQCPYCP